MTPQGDRPRATIVGTGLIGGSIGLGLRARGWHVSGIDTDDEAIGLGVELGALDRRGVDERSDLVVVATPVGAIAATVIEILATCPDAVVTDVGGVKGPITTAVTDRRFVGGHPMAGSERLGIEGANDELFRGAAWVLTPTAHTDDRAFSTVRDMASSLGAEVLTLDPQRHDALVAVVSHVPHLTAAALVGVASQHADDHPALLRLAAGGFRDMTRIAAGSPSIWPDVCAQNREAIVETLDELIADLGTIRSMVADTDKVAVLDTLRRAQTVRRSLPSRATDIVESVAVRVPILDRPGSVAAVAGIATDIGVNLRSLQTIDAGDAGGVLELLLAAGDVDTLREALLAAGFRLVVLQDQEGGTP